MSEKSPEPEQSHKESKNPEPKGYERTIARWTVILGTSTILLFIATGISAYFLYVTDQTLRDTLATNARAAKATEESVKLSADTAKRQLCAYLTVEAAKINCANCPKGDWKAPKGERPETEFLLTIKNVGLTPAYEVRSCSGRRLVEPNTFLPDDFKFACKQACDKCPPTNIAPGANAIMTMPLDLADIMMSGAGFKKLYYYGSISFADTFKAKRELPFCWTYQGPSDVGIDCPQHNSPNED